MSPTADVNNETNQFEEEVNFDQEFDDFEDQIFSTNSVYAPINGRSSYSELSEAAGHPIAGSSSIFDAVWHIVCVIAGSGVLSLPFALSQGGWFGIILIMIAAWLNNYAGKVLIKCLHVNGPPLKSFAAIGYQAYGPAGKSVVDFFANLMMLGVTCVYLILAGMNISEMIGGSTRVWIFLCGVLVLLPYLCFKTLKEVAILSFFGVFATTLVIVLVIYYSIEDIPVYSSKVHHTFLDFWMVPMALSSISFSFSGNFIYPQVQASMKNPQDFPLVLKWSMAVISSMYIVTSIFGYWAYGNETVSPILHNLPKGAASTFATVMITAHVLLACPILLTTFSMEFERRLKLDKHPEASKRRFLIRTAIMFLLIMIAMLMPYFADFMALLGAIGSTLLVFIIPVVFDWKLFGFFGTGFHVRSKRDIATGVFCVSLGSYAGIIGTIAALQSLYTDIMSGNGGGAHHRRK